MKILYLSCHSILEYDELRLFESLGYDYFSLGGYINPKAPHDPKRPALNGEYHERLASVAMVHNQNDLHPEQIDWADVIIVMHKPEWIANNWEKMKHKRVIWRTIGQSVRETEEALRPYREQGLEIVRYSPAEQNIPGYIGQDALIRFYKDPKEFIGWEGKESRIMTVGQSMRTRGSHCNYPTFHEATQGLQADLYGPGNEGCEEARGEITYDDLKMHMKNHRVFFFTGTHPASYTLGFIEAFMTGIPIVSIGHGFGNSKVYGQKTFEIPDIIKTGVNGFVSDNVQELRRFCETLLKDEAMARSISVSARQTAVQLFGMDTIRDQWKTYLEQGPKK